MIKSQNTKYNNLIIVQITDISNMNSLPSILFVYRYNKRCFKLRCAFQTSSPFYFSFRKLSSSDTIMKESRRP